MTQLLIKTIADFSTTLTSKTAISATTATLTSGIDSDGIQLPTGVYGFTIDRNNAQKEHFTATLTGDALTDIKTVTRGTGVGTAGLIRTHRKGAEIVITDHVAIKRMMNVLDGTTSFDASTPLGYDGAPTISTGNQFATKTYVDGVAIAGSPDATTSTKGISKMSVAPVSASSPIAVGDNDGRVPTQNENDALVGTSGTPSSSNKYITDADTATTATASKVARRLASGDITVNTTPTNSTDAASKSYVDSLTSTKLSITPATVDVGTSSTAENTLLTYSLSGGVLSTNNAVKIQGYITISNGGTVATCTLRFKFGSTTYYSPTFAMSGGLTSYTHKFEWLIISSGTTGTQNTDLIMYYTSASNPGTILTSTSTEDSTSAKNIIITAQNSNADSSFHATIRNVVITKIA